MAPESIEAYAARVRGVCLDCGLDLDVCTCGWDDDTYRPADDGADFGDDAA